MINTQIDIQEYFQSILIKREIPYDLYKDIPSEDCLILTKVGLPNNILNYNFTIPIKYKNADELIIGSLEGKSVIFNIKTRIVYINDNSFYLAKNVKCFLFQLYTYDYLWNVMITNNHLGKYREDKNYLKYSKFLEDQLLKIDSELLKKDKNYYWGALIEDIEFGIIG